MTARSTSIRTTTCSPALFALDAKSGAIKWTAERPDMLAGYAVPVICEANGQTDVVISGSGFLKGYDPATGAERWSSNSMLRTMMTSPVVRDGIIYLSCQSYGDENAHAEVRAAGMARHEPRRQADEGRNPERVRRALRRVRQEQRRRDRRRRTRHGVSIGQEPSRRRQHHSGRPRRRPRRRDQDARPVEHQKQVAVEHRLAARRRRATLHRQKGRPVQFLRRRDRQDRIGNSTASATSATTTLRPSPATARFSSPAKTASSSCWNKARS